MYVCFLRSRDTEHYYETKYVQQASNEAIVEKGASEYSFNAWRACTAISPGLTCTDTLSVRCNNESPRDLDW